MRTSKSHWLEGKALAQDSFLPGKVRKTRSGKERANLETADRASAGDRGCLGADGGALDGKGKLGHAQDIDFRGLLLIGVLVCLLSANEL